MSWSLIDDHSWFNYDEKYLRLYFLETHIAMHKLCQFKKKILSFLIVLLENVEADRIMMEQQKSKKMKK